MLFQQNALFDSLSVWENVAFTLIHGHGMARPRRQATGDGDFSSPWASGRTWPTSRRPSFPAACRSAWRSAARSAPTAPLPSCSTTRPPASTRFSPAPSSTLIRDAIARTGATALTVTSDMGIARRSFDRLAMLHDGAILWQGAAGDIDESGNAYLDQLINQRADGPIRAHATA